MDILDQLRMVMGNVEWLSNGLQRDIGGPSKSGLSLAITRVRTDLFINKNVVFQHSVSRSLYVVENYRRGQVEDIL